VGRGHELDHDAAVFYSLDRLVPGVDAEVLANVFLDRDLAAFSDSTRHCLSSDCSHIDVDKYVSTRHARQQLVAWASSAGRLAKSARWLRNIDPIIGLRLLASAGAAMARQRPVSVLAIPARQPCQARFRIRQALAPPAPRL